MDREAWCVAIHGVAKSRTWLSDWSDLIWSEVSMFVWTGGWGMSLWCQEGLGAGGEAGNRGWDGWMASLTRWTWVWVNSGSWWWTGSAGVLRFMGSQRVGHDWATDLIWSDLKCHIYRYFMPYCSKFYLCLQFHGLCMWNFASRKVKRIIFKYWVSDWTCISFIGFF